jgi:membrane-bound metal-dependent hydrolase YbcI (DUF457 family)
VAFDHARREEVPGRFVFPDDLVRGWIDLDHPRIRHRVIETMVRPIVTASHGILDAITDGGLGVAFFAPCDDTRYFFPFRPIKVSPIGLSFFSARGLDVIWSEFLWVCIPGTIIAAAVLSLRKLRRLRASPAAE